MIFPALNFLVGGWPTPLKNMSSSVRITIPNICKIKFHGSSHHQSVLNDSLDQVLITNNLITTITHY